MNISHTAPFPSQSDVPGSTVVSRIHLNGKWITLSLYQDDEWQFNDAPTNTSRFRRYIRFAKIPTVFRATLKYLSWHWLSHGRAGKIRPRPGTVASFILEINFFLRWLSTQNICTLNRVTVELCITWARELQQYQSIRTGKTLKPATLSRRLAALETLFELGQFAPEHMIPHPWPGTSSHRLARMNNKTIMMHNTPLMPDFVFTALFQHAWKKVKQADELLRHHEALLYASKSVADKCPSTRAIARNTCLKTRGWSHGLTSLYQDLHHLGTACYIVIASLSGCRNHELAWLQTGACYRIRHENGDILWWMRSRSTKTGEGQTEWMIPPAAVRAIRVAERLASPLQKELQIEIRQKEQANPHDPEILEARRHQGAIFLGRHPRTRQIRTLGGGQWNLRLKAFCKTHEIPWKISTHQFRRKFANYAAQSQFGDLRYLREHFKHWSMDMTLRYAMSDRQEMTLLSEIEGDVETLKITLIDNWLQAVTPLAGGYGKNLMHWRQTTPSHIFHSHEHMLRSMAESTSIRSNGHAWCTADNRRCSGNSPQNMLRCVECSNAVIDSSHLSVYQQLYDDLSTLKTRVHHPVALHHLSEDIRRCKSVMKSLGIPLSDGNDDESTT